MSEDFRQGGEPLSARVMNSESPMTPASINPADFHPKKQAVSK